MENMLQKLYIARVRPIAGDAHGHAMPIFQGITNIKLLGAYQTEHVFVADGSSVPICRGGPPIYDE